MQTDSFPARIRPLAADDLLEIVRYLDTQSDQAGNLFRDDIHPAHYRTTVKAPGNGRDSTNARSAQGPTVVADEPVRELSRVLPADPRRD